MNIKDAIHKVAGKEHLSPLEMQTVMCAIMQGEATPAQIGGFLMGLRMKGETVEELTAAAEVMRSLATPLPFSAPHLIDTCGTGGDGQHLFNVSTTVAFIVAAAGGKVVKHGNRSNSSNSGSADVLESLGVQIERSPEQTIQSIEQSGIGFLFAPHFHQAMKHAAGTRKELGTRTLFNLLGPLCNPAKPPHQLIGIFSEEWLVPFAETLKRLGSQHVLVVHSEDGLDEISLNAPTEVAELKVGKITTYSIKPEQFGLQRNAMADCVVQSVEQSKQKLLSVLNNEPGSARDLVLLNAGAAIYAADLTNTLKEGFRKADEVLKNGQAKKILEKFISLNEE